jgi:opacity protein-like surface antigen
VEISILKKIIFSLLQGSIVLGLTAVTPVWADASLPSGWYVEGNLGQSKSMGKSYPGVFSIKNTGNGWNVSGGYKFMPFLAAEAGYTRYAVARLNVPTETVARDSHYSLDIAGKAILPIATSGFELFGKLGVVRINSQVGVIDAATAAAYHISFATQSKSSTGLYIGGGAEYAFTSNIAGNIQWEKAKGNTKTGSLQLLSAGIAYSIDPAFL